MVSWLQLAMEDEEVLLIMELWEVEKILKVFGMVVVLQGDFLVSAWLRFGSPSDYS